MARLRMTIFGLPAIVLAACTQLTGVDSLTFVAESDGGDVSVGDGCAAQPVAVMGDPCCTMNELACAGHAQKLVLVCNPKNKLWEALQSCTGQQLCDTRPGSTQGSCQEPVALCVGKKPGDKVCDGSKSVVCGIDLLTSTETPCTGACTNGECSGSCTSGVRQCSGSTPQVCDSNGKWQSEAPCPYACTGQGQCTGLCVVGTKQCDGKMPQTCGTDGKWKDGTVCSNVCSNGECSGSCVPQSKQCKALVPQTCNAQGGWDDGAPCPYLCTGGHCAGVCTPGDKLCNGKIPQTCDSQGAWQSAAACPVVCSAGQCATSCNNGDKQCSGKVPETCVSGAWQDATVCAHVCLAGICIGLCDPGSKQCSGATPQTCDAQGAWQSGAACPYVCSGGSCAGVCAPGTKQCTGQTAQTCDATGHFQDDQVCPFVCNAGVCGGVCAPSTKQCSGLTPQTCDASGQWQSGTGCQYICNAGVCSGACSPGIKQCVGLTPQLCDGSGQWQAGAPCPYVCGGGDCTGVCAPGGKQCSGQTPQNCDASGQWQNGSVCQYVCAAGACAGSCTPASTQCSGLTPQTCSGGGQWQDGSPCQYVCSGGSCTGVCSPGTKQCSGVWPQTCNASGQWQNGGACPYICSGGNCGGVCSPGSKQCVGNTAQTCQANGQWDAGNACSGALPICVGGNCIGPPPPPTLVDQTDLSDCSAVYPTLSWNAVSSPDSDPVEYLVEVDDSSAFTSIDASSGWIPTTNWTVGLGVNYLWYWRVTARDAVHTAAVSAPSTPDSFYAWVCTPSCPLIYVWNGLSYKYQTDIQGEFIDMTPGSLGAKSIPNYRAGYIVLKDLLWDEGGILRVKIRETLPESSFADELRLFAADYPEGYEIASSSAESTYSFAYTKPFKIYTLYQPRLPVAAMDRFDNDVLSYVTSLDDNPAPITPYALEYYTFDFGQVTDLAHARLVIDGWSAFNVIKGAPTIQPHIEVQDANGNWVSVLVFSPPAGDLKTLVVEIPNLFLSDSRLIRIHMGMRSNSEWLIDRIRLDESTPLTVETTELVNTMADLHHRGRATYEGASFVHRFWGQDDVLPDEPLAYGYGNYTRYGPIEELLGATDDRFAILRHGDEIEMEFLDQIPVAPGMVRTYLLKADVFYKSLKSSKLVTPMPFHGMSKYPYVAPEAYPTDAFHTDYQNQYNTRVLPLP